MIPVKTEIYFCTIESNKGASRRVGEEERFKIVNAHFRELLFFEETKAVRPTLHFTNLACQIKLNVNPQKLP